MTIAKRSDVSETQGLEARLQQGGYEGYAYAYPHKTSYREFDSPLALESLWGSENKKELFLYVHLPFCEFRCGFCNLLTTTNPKESLVDQYIKALRTQSSVVKRCVEPEKILQVAIGGGTPSYLSANELNTFFEFLETDWKLSSSSAPIAFEVSPGTVDADRLQVLTEYQVQRVSMGVQTFVEGELKLLGRPQKKAEVVKACELIKSSDIPVFNLDLIYGAVGQTPQSWVESLKQAVAWEPEEIYLYPLYVRDLTGLGRRGDSPSVRRHKLYEIGRDYLQAEGYQQESMRYFRKPDALAVDSEWSCQEDGMIGLGAGARSYTQTTHYSSEYAVGMSSVRNIINSYCEQSSDQFSQAHYGVHLDEQEQRRRYVIKSLLRSAGLDLSSYKRQFGTNANTDFKELHELKVLKLLETYEGKVRLTPLGMSHSDTIGPWLYSDHVKAQMDDYELT